MKKIASCVLGVLMLFGLLEAGQAVGPQAQRAAGSETAAAVSAGEYLALAPDGVPRTEAPVTEEAVPGTSPEEAERQEKAKGKVDTTDLLFVGNSLVDGIRIMTDEDCLCKEGLKTKIYGELETRSCRNVVIEMGTNEMGIYSPEKFTRLYQELIDHIRSINPEAKIVCLSIPPVSAKKDASSENFKNRFVVRCNQCIQQLCEENGTIYLDNTPFFGTVLSPDITSDGIHFKVKWYSLWHDYIIQTLEDMNG